MMVKKSNKEVQNSLIRNIIMVLTICKRASSYRFYVIVILKVLLGFTPAIVMYIWKRFLDSAITAIQGSNKGIVECILVIMIYCFISLLRDSLTRVVDYYFKWEADYLDKTIIEKSLDFIESLNGEDIEESSTFDILGKVNDQTADRIYSMLSNIFLFIESLVSAVATAYLLIGLSELPIALGVFSTIPSFLIAMKIIAEYYGIYNKRYETMRLIERLKALIFDSNNLKEIKAYRSNRYLKTYISNIYEDFIKKDCRRRKKNLMNTSFAQVFDFALLYASKIYIIIKAIKEHLTIGSITMQLSAVEGFVGALNALLEITEELQDNSLYLSSFNEFMSMQEGNKKEQKLNIPIETIELKAVEYEYVNTFKKAIKGISYKFEKGKKYCILGKNGSGKSTLVKIISGIYKPCKGDVLVNDETLDENLNADVHARVGVMFQNYIKYPLSIRENIGIGDLNGIIDIDRVNTSAELSGVDKVVIDLENKYDTRLGKEWNQGIEFSGGEWQRIAIARAFYEDRDFYILDEPTASIDKQSERYFFDRLVNLSNKAILYIVHDPRLAVWADEIIVMDEGKIVENGEYEKLKEKQGYFYNMLQEMENRNVTERSRI